MELGSLTPRLSPQRIAAWLALVAAMAALAYGSNLADAGDPPADVLYRWSTAVAAAVLYAVSGDEDDDKIVGPCLSQKTAHAVQDAVARHLIIGQREGLGVAIETVTRLRRKGASDGRGIRIGETQIQGLILVATDPDRQNP